MAKGNCKVLITTGIYPPDIGGPATYSKLLFEELPKYGISVGVLSFGLVRRLPKIIRHLVYFYKVLKVGRSADLIFAQDPVSVGLPAALAAKILRKKFILKIVGDYAWEQGMNRFGIKDLLDNFQVRHYDWPVEFLRKIQRWTANRAQRIIVPSFYLKKIVSQWGVAEEKIQVVYNAIEELSLVESSGNKNIILSVGRLVPWKGFGTLIEIMVELPREIKLVIAGSGPEAENLKRQIEELGLGDRVELIGQVSRQKLAEYFAQARIFVLNTAYEGLSHLILEAMQQGVPVVTTKVGGNPELIQNGYNGVLIEYSSRQQLKEAILRLWFNKDLQQKFVENSWQKLKQFNLERMIEETLKVLTL